MRIINVLWLLTLAMLGCGQHKDHSHDEWLPHHPTSYVLTPAGHVRDAGPFGSVAGGFTSDAAIDAAIDWGYQHLQDVTGYTAANVGIGLNDDYVMWDAVQQQWAGGIQIDGDGMIHVCIWSRLTSNDDPGLCWIKRAPGNSFGVEYVVWRHTGFPLGPAVAHELLHTIIGDSGHTSPLWAKL